MAELELKFVPDASEVRRELQNVQQEASRGVTVPVSGGGAFAGRPLPAGFATPAGFGSTPGVPGGSPAGQALERANLQLSRAVERQAQAVERATQQLSRTAAVGAGGVAGRGGADQGSILTRSLGGGLGTSLYFQALFSAGEAVKGYQRAAEANRLSSTIGGLTGASAQLKAAEQTSGGFLGAIASGAIDIAGSFSDSIPTLSRARQAVGDAEAGVAGNLAMVGQLAAIRESNRRIGAIDAESRRFSARGSYYRRALQGFDEVAEARQEFQDKSEEMRARLNALDGSDKVEEAQKLAGDIGTYERSRPREIEAMQRRAESAAREQVRLATRVLSGLNRQRRETNAGLEGRFGQQRYLQFQRELADEVDAEDEPVLREAIQENASRRLRIEDLHIQGDIKGRQSRIATIDAILNGRPQDARRFSAAERRRRALEDATDAEVPGVETEQDQIDALEERRLATRRRIRSAGLAFEQRASALDASTNSQLSYRSRGQIADTERLYGAYVTRAAAAFADDENDNRVRDARSILETGRSRLQALRQDVGRVVGGSEVSSPFNIGSKGADDTETLKQIDRKLGEIAELLRDPSRLGTDGGLAP